MASIARSASIVIVCLLSTLCFSKGQEVVNFNSTTPPGPVSGSALLGSIVLAAAFNSASGTPGLATFLLDANNGSLTYIINNIDTDSNSSISASLYTSPLNGEPQLAAPIFEQPSSEDNSFGGISTPIGGRTEIPLEVAQSMATDPTQYVVGINQSSLIIFSTPLTDNVSSLYNVPPMAAIDPTAAIQDLYIAIFGNTTGRTEQLSGNVSTDLVLTPGMVRAAEETGGPPSPVIRPNTQTAAPPPHLPASSLSPPAPRSAMDDANAIASDVAGVFTPSPPPPPPDSQTSVILDLLASLLGSNSGSGSDVGSGDGSGEESSGDAGQLVVDDVAGYLNGSAFDSSGNVDTTELLGVMMNALVGDGTDSNTLDTLRNIFGTNN